MSTQTAECLYVQIDKYIFHFEQIGKEKQSVCTNHISDSYFISFLFWKKIIVTRHHWNHLNHVFAVMLFLPRVCFSPPAVEVCVCVCVWRFNVSPLVEGPVCHVASLNNAGQRPRLSDTLFPLCWSQISWKEELCDGSYFEENSRRFLTEAWRRNPPQDNRFRLDIHTTRSGTCLSSHRERSDSQGVCVAMVQGVVRHTVVSLSIEYPCCFIFFSMRFSSLFLSVHTGATASGSVYLLLRYFSCICVRFFLHINVSVNRMLVMLSDI